MWIDTIHTGNCLDYLRELPPESVDCCVTSPPYYGLRDYGVAEQIGLEESPETYVARLTEVFQEVRRVLKSDGTLWVNLGDSYNGSGKNTGNNKATINNRAADKRTNIAGLKVKDLIGTPWMLAFALRADGWYLRQEIIWSKPNPMPESVRDRCTKSHESLFLFAKSPKYYFDHKAIMEPAKYDGRKDTRMKGSHKYSQQEATGIRPQTFAARGHERWQRGQDGEFMRNKRDVWSVRTRPFKGAHFATFPEELISPCILAGSRGGGVVLDPFMGAGTTAVVAKKLGRHFAGCDLNPEYVAIAEKRLTDFKTGK